MAIRGVWWRTTAILGAALLLLATAGCGTRGAPPSGEPEYADIGAVPEKLAADGTTIVVGSSSAPVTLSLYEEPRCPACREFEVNGAGPDLRDMLVERKVRIEYTMASFLDRDGSGGSKRAVNALRAALEKDLFLEYHKILYSSLGPGTTGHVTPDTLLSLATLVEGLRGKKFDAAVAGMTYEDFVADSQRAYDADGVDGTPTMLINGGRIAPAHGGVLFETDLIEYYVDLYVKNDGDVPV